MKSFLTLGNRCVAAGLLFALLQWIYADWNYQMNFAAHILAVRWVAFLFTFPVLFALGMGLTTAAYLGIWQWIGRRAGCLGRARARWVWLFALTAVYLAIARFGMLRVFSIFEFHVQPSLELLLHPGSLLGMAALLMAASCKAWDAVEREAFSATESLYRFWLPFFWLPLLPLTALSSMLLRTPATLPGMTSPNAGRRRLAALLPALALTVLHFWKIAVYRETKTLEQLSESAMLAGFLLLFLPLRGAAPEREHASWREYLSPLAVMAILLALVWAYGNHPLDRFYLKQNSNTPYTIAAFIHHVKADIENRIGRTNYKRRLLLRHFDMQELPSAPAPVRTRMEWTEPRPPWNLLVVSVDCLRASSMSLFGYKRETTPFIDEWAREQIVFERAYACGPSTRMSMTGFWTGQYRGQEQRGADWVLLAELAKQGYDAARTTLYLQETIPVTVLPPYGGVPWDHRFEELRPELPAIDFLRAPRDRPFAVWVHLFYPHFPYVWREGTPRFGDRDIDRYDSGIAYTDLQFRHLLEVLRETSQYDNTVIVFLGDHGEEFFEHSYRFHGFNVHDVNVRVPLILRVPGLAPAFIPEPVSVIDMAPTLAELLRVPGEMEIHGASLLPRMQGSEPEDRPVFSIGRWSTKFMMVQGDWKYIFDPETLEEELFQLKLDPEERNNLAVRETEQTRIMRARFAPWFFAGRDTYSAHVFAELKRSDDPE